MATVYWLFNPGYQAQENAKANEAAYRGGETGTAGPLVDKQQQHHRIREISLGITTEEVAIGPPVGVDWKSHLEQLRELGFEVED